MVTSSQNGDSRSTEISSSFHNYQAEDSLISFQETNLLSRQETEENPRSTTSIGNPRLSELERTINQSILKVMVLENGTPLKEPTVTGGNSIDSTADTLETCRTPRSSLFGLVLILKVNKLPLGKPIMVKTKSGTLCMLKMLQSNQLKV